MRIIVSTISKNRNILDITKYFFRDIEKKNINISLFKSYRLLNVYKFFNNKNYIYKTSLVNKFNEQEILKNNLGKIEFEIDLYKYETENYYKNKILYNLLKKSINKKKVIFKLYEYDLTKIYICIEEKLEKNINEKVYFSALINKIEEIKQDLFRIFNCYNFIFRKNKLNNNFWNFYEHIQFNYCFNFAKKYNLKINPIYINQFGGPKEIIIKNPYVKYYYPKINNSEKLLITNVGIYSITTRKSGEKIIKEILSILKFCGKNSKELIVTDGTAGVGGDSIYLASIFKKVNSIEIIKEHYEVCKNNFEVFGLNNINLMNTNYLDIYKDLKNDVIYLDSPWGGTDYMNKNKTELKMFGTELKFNTFIKNILEINNELIIILKCPKNFSILDISSTVIQNSELKKKNMSIKGVSNFLLVCFY